VVGTDFAPFHPASSDELNLEFSLVATENTCTAPAALLFHPGEEPDMLQNTLNVTPLFQTSLRTWQATYKARQGLAEGNPAPEPHSQRLARPKRRPRRPVHHRPQG
jgi:hypothetical protein